MLIHMALLFLFLHRYDEQFVVANFDSAPTTDSECFGKLDPSIRDEHESRVSYVLPITMSIVQLSLFYIVGILCSGVRR